jgi:hypothetical protein
MDAGFFTEKLYELLHFQRIKLPECLQATVTFTERKQIMNSKRLQNIEQPVKGLTYRLRQEISTLFITHFSTFKLEFH